MRRPVTRVVERNGITLGSCRESGKSSQTANVSFSVTFPLLFAFFSDTFAVFVSSFPLLFLFFSASFRLLFAMVVPFQNEWSSRAGEFHPHPLTEPYLKLSPHTALLTLVAASGM